MNSNFTAIILAGGKSSRIGEDKALLKLEGISIIERIYDILKNIFDDIIIVANNTEKYKFLSSQIYEDIYPGFGPLSGIHSGLFNSTTNNNFVISCDMPMINEKLIKFIISKNSGSEIILPKSNSNVYSLCGIYKRSCLNIAESFIKTAADNLDEQSGKTKIKLFDLINSINTDYIELNSEIDNVSDIMFNMNTLDDFEFVKENYFRL